MRDISSTEPLASTGRSLRSASSLGGEHLCNVLLVSPQPFLEWRGSSIRVAQTAEALADSGYRVDLLTQPIGQDHEMGGVRIFRAPNWFGIRRLPIGPSPAKALADISLGLATWRRLQQRDYQVVHGFEEAGVMAVTLAQRHGARSIYEVHSDPASYLAGPVRNGVMWAYEQVERWTARHADAVVCTGAGLAERMREASPGTAVHEIGDIASSRIEPTRAEVEQTKTQLQSAPGNNVVLYVGSFASYQGLDLLLEAASEVRARHPKVSFVVIGGSVEAIRKKRRHLAERGAEDAVRFLGRLPPDELPRYLAAADVLVSPRIEGVNSPLKVLDYLKAGVPIVATDIAAHRALLDASTAQLVEPMVGAMAEGILAVLGDPKLGVQLSTTAWSRYERHHSFEAFRDQLTTVYRSLRDLPV